MSEIKVGLALGSGSMRGFAHIGVLQALEEEGVPIDMVAGTSMGAIVGAIYCVGSDMKFVEKLVYSLEERDYLDVTVPRHGLLRGDRVQALLRTLTHDALVEETKIPFAAIACDIERGEAYIPQNCKLHEAVRASMSIPGVFKPYYLHGRMLVDGAIIDRIPTSVVRGMGADMVIAVDVAYRESREKISNMMEIIMRSFEILEWESSRERLQTADIVISPNTTRINPYTFSQAEECVKNGRIATKEAIDRIWKAIEAAKTAKKNREDYEPGGL